MNSLATPAETVRSAPATDLQHLLDPISPDVFRERYYGREVLVLHRKDRGHYRDVLALADLDSVMLAASGLNKTILQVVPPPAAKRAADLYMMSGISKDRLYQAYLSGDTIRLISVDQYWPPIARLAASMQAALDAKPGMNIFLTPPRSQGFSLHFDLVDTFLLQVGGAKRWQIWRPTYEQPMETTLSQHHLPKVSQLDETRLTLCNDVLLEAGDLLYMPRGYYHRGTTEEDLSLHVTAIVKPVYWLDFMHRAFELAALDDAALREALPPGWVGDPRVQESVARRFADMVSRFAAAASFDQGFESLVDEELRARTFPPDGHFEVLAELQSVSLNSVLERRAGLACAVEISLQQAAIRFGPSSVQGPVALALPLQFVRDNAVFRVADLPDVLSPESKVTLARRLVREGLLRPQAAGRPQRM
jgi:lysine-specific demethylase/histidyl-hydroxylase NO66